ncbi:hypothetical protein [Halomonas sp. 3D7M]|uniref:hypothetical protein n=1 Tax=Halomonas sp. 3D7M TaxID=2742617 RepID=UPI0018674AF2|nr:hypothetical protein [Halomonas sp. 3D7M]
MDFEKPGLGAQFSQLGYLLKHTFTIIGRDTDILSPIIRMSVYAAFVVVLFFAGIAAIIVGMGGTGTLLLLAMVIVFVYKFFYYNHQELRLSRLVYDTACGRDATVQGARKELADVKGRARILGLIDMANVWVVLKRGNGGLITRLILGALVEIWDLVNHFLLPVFAIDKLSFREGGERLHTLRDHVPETLVGVFGIDIMGNVVRTILGPLYLIAIILGIILGLASGGFMPTAFSAGSLGELFGSIGGAVRQHSGRAAARRTDAIQLATALRAYLPSLHRQRDPRAAGDGDQGDLLHPVLHPHRPRGCP